MNDAQYDEGEVTSPEIAAPQTTGNAIEDIAALAAFQLALEARVAEKEAELKTVKEALKGVSERDLPNAILALGVAEVPLADGSKVKVSTSVEASISEAKKPMAFEWLREHEHGHIIKRELAIYFGVGEDELAQTVLDAMKEKAPNNQLESGESIHAGTLKKFVREKLVAEAEVLKDNPEAILNDALPRELFGVFIKNTSKIIPPTKAKGQTAKARDAQSNEF